MAIDLQKLEQKFDALINDSNFVTDFEQWLEARRSRQHDAKLPVIGSVCPDCLMGRDEFEPEWKCPDCRGQTDL